MHGMHSADLELHCEIMLRHGIWTPLQPTLPPNSTICVGSWALCSAVSVRAIAKVILELVEACPNGPPAKPGSEPCEEDREMR